MKTLKMPFDGQRMIFGGFSPFVEKGSGRGTSYADGFVVPVPAANRDAYIGMASNAARVFEEYGALRVVADFRRAVDAKDDEMIVFSWIEWPSKKARDEAWPKLMADPRMQPNKDNMPFDGKRMIYGGFATTRRLKQKTLQPLNNPFSKRLSLMS